MSGARHSHIGKTIAFWCCGFFAPVLFLVLLCAINGVYPFGAESFLTEDAKYQYVDFFTWYKHVLAGDSSLLYSTSQSLGMNTWSLFSYYLASPLNVLIVFFDESHIVSFLFLICAIRLGLIQISFMWYLKSRFDGLGTWVLPIALGVTLCTWVATDIRNPMWLDMLIWLPLAMAGVYRLLKQRTWGLLLVSVAAAIITCWYTAYMLIIFIVLYALFESAVERASDSGFTLRRFFSFLARGAGLIVLALAISAFTFAPTLLSFLGDASGDIAPVEARPETSMVVVQEEQLGAQGQLEVVDVSEEDAPVVDAGSVALQSEPVAPQSGNSIAYKVLQLVKGFFTGEIDPSDSLQVPQLFGGALLIAGALFFLLSRRVNRRVKVAFVIFAGFLVLSVAIKPLYVFWCGMREPSGFYCRIAVFFPVALLWATGFGMREALGRPFQAGPAVIAGFVSCAPACLLWGFGLLSSLPCTIIAVACAACSVLALFAVSADCKGSMAPTLVCALLACVVLAELVASGCVAWSKLYAGYPQEYHDAYVRHSQQTQESLARRDDGLYREAKTYGRIGRAALNEGLSSNYMEISSYISAHDGDAVRFLNALGYGRPGEMSVQYRNPMLLADAILGVKYVLTPGDASGYVLVEGNDDYAFSMSVQDLSGNRLYQNPYALPLAYEVSDDVASLAFDTPSNPFERQNQLASALVGHDVGLYRRIDAQLAPSDSCQVWQVNVPAGQVGYYYVMDNAEDMTTALPKCYVQVGDGVPIDDAWRFGNSVTPLGAQDEVAVQPMSYVVRLASDPAMSTPPPSENWCIFYGLDLNALSAFYEELSSDAIAIAKFKDASIVFEASVDAPEGTMVLVSVPFDSGWSARIDGSSAETVSLAEGALMGVRVPQGKSTVTLSYTPPGLIAGCIISACALLIVALLVFVSRKRRSARRL